jgi:hypothetical protein
MKKNILTLTVAIGLSACQSTNYEAKGRFLTNDNLQVIAPPQLSEISRSWKNDARAVFGRSKTDAGTVAWIADFIAFNEAQGTEGIGRCNVLTALELKPLQLKPFDIYDAVKRQPRKYSPVQYYEAWVVDACGKQREWRVFDDPMDPRNPLTVILWRASR